MSYEDLSNCLYSSSSNVMKQTPKMNDTYLEGESNPNRLILEQQVGDLFENCKAACFASKEMAQYSLFHLMSPQQLKFQANSKIKKDLSDQLEVQRKFLGQSISDFSTQDAQETGSLAVLSLYEWEMLNKKQVHKKLNIAVEVTVGDLIRDPNVRHFLPSQFKVNYLIFKVAKIFRDRPCALSFIVGRSSSELDELVEIGKTMGNMPCSFECFETLNNFKLLNLFQQRKSKTKVDQNLVVGPKNNAKHYANISRKVLQEKEKITISGQGQLTEKVNGVLTILEGDGIVGAKEVISDNKYIKNTKGQGVKSVPQLEIHISRNEKCVQILKDKYPEIFYDEE